MGPDGRASDSSAQRFARLLETGQHPPQLLRVRKLQACCKRMGSEQLGGDAAGTSILPPRGLSTRHGRKIFLCKSRWVEEKLWITRKGASKAQSVSCSAGVSVTHTLFARTSAKVGQLGIIPGSPQTARGRFRRTCVLRAHGILRHGHWLLHSAWQG